VIAKDVLALGQTQWGLDDPLWARLAKVVVADDACSLVLRETVRVDALEFVYSFPGRYSFRAHLAAEQLGSADGAIGRNEAEMGGIQAELVDVTQHLLLLVGGRTGVLVAIVVRLLHTTCHEMAALAGNGEAGS
jgi:hypothetical protein